MHSAPTEPPCQPGCTQDNMSTWDGEDRFSLLLLEDGEYYFRDYNCHLWPAGKDRSACQVELYACLHGPCSMPT